jgi:gas vesicle protein
VRKKTFSFIAGFYAGTLVGGTIALLFAPQPGEETRARIRQKRNELKEQADRIYAQVLNGLETTTRNVLRRTEQRSARLQARHTWDEDELARWDQELAEIEQAAQEALEEARMG